MTASDTPFGAWSNPKTLLGLAALWLALLVLFRLLPQIDLAVARAFFDEAVCATNTRANGTCLGFPVALDALANAVRDTLHYLPAALALACGIWCLAARARGASFFADAQRIRGVLALSFLLGPLLLVNGLMKPFIPRARPISTEGFGGLLDFTPAGSFAGACDFNCSFVSGEAAAGGWLIALSLLLPPSWRVRGAVFLAVTGAIMAFLRVAFGAHYLSDATLGYLSSMVILAGLALISDVWTARRRASA